MREINAQEIVARISTRPPFYYDTIFASRFGRFGEFQANMSDLFTRMIKEAARCNSYSSDVIFLIDDIRERLHDFDPDNPNSYEPIFVGFRKMGVDGTNTMVNIIQRKSQRYEHAILIPDDYFSFFVIQFHDADYGEISIEVKAYYV